MRRIVPAIAVVLLTAACSSTATQSTPTAGPSSSEVAASTPAGLTDDSTCADYLQASDHARTVFVVSDIDTHDPQTDAPSFGLMTNFIKGALEHQCPSKPMSKLGDLLAPAWTSSPTP